MKSNALFAVIACVALPGIAFSQVPTPQGTAAQIRTNCEGQPVAPAAPAQGRGVAPLQSPRVATVAAIPGIIAPGAQFTQVWQTVGNNADGIIALPDGSVLVNQEESNAVIKLDGNDKVSVFLSDTKGSGALSMNRRGQILAVQRVPQRDTPAAVNPAAPTVAGISMLYPERKMVADTFSDGTKWTGRPNDLAADAVGGAYFSQGCVYYASPDGTIALAAENIRSNGIVLSADEKTLYVTNGGTLSVFDAPAPGKLTNRREWSLEGGGNPDGTTIDADGRVYVSSRAGVQIFTPQGKYLGLIPTPRALTSVVFAGPEKRTLYLVGQGSTDANGQPSAVGATGRTIYRIPMLAQGLKGRSK